MTIATFATYIGAPGSRMERERAGREIEGRQPKDHWFLLGKRFEHEITVKKITGMKQLVK